MPNWTWNKVVCKKQLLDKLVDKTDDVYSLDFNKLIPMPESLEIVADSFEEKAVASYYLSLNKTDKCELHDELENTKLDFYGNYWEKYKNYIRDYKDNPNKLEEVNKSFDKMEKKDYRNITNLTELGKLYVFNILNFGNSQWYDWCCNHWGTKWNVLNDVDVKYNKSFKKYEIIFHTPWSPPYGIIYAYSQLCNEKDFHWEYQCEDEEIHYCFKKKNNKLIRKKLDKEKGEVDDEREM